MRSIIQSGSVTYHFIANLVVNAPSSIIVANSFLRVSSIPSLAKGPETPFD